MGAAVDKGPHRPGPVRLKIIGVSPMWLARKSPGSGISLSRPRKLHTARGRSAPAHAYRSGIVIEAVGHPAVIDAGQIAAVNDHYRVRLYS